MAVPYGTRFPQYLSMQLQILWFELDEWFLILYVFYMAQSMKSLLALVLIPLPYLFIKAKRKGSKGFFKHLLFRYGLISFDGYPTYFMRKFRE